MRREVELPAMLEPATEGEFGENAGGEQGHTDGEGADDPIQFHAAFEHKPVKQCQNKNQNGRLGKERGAAMGCDGDEIEKWGALF
jgi:hypothetical protein